MPSQSALQQYGSAKQMASTHGSQPVANGPMSGTHKSCAHAQLTPQVAITALTQL